MPRWITVNRAFDYTFPSRAIMHFGEHEHYPFPREEFVKDEIADYAITRGHATEGKKDSAARSRKGATSRTRRAKTSGDAQAADRGPHAGVGRQDVPADRRSSARRSVGKAAS